MKTLTLIRHSETEFTSNDGSDFNRELTDNGKDQAITLFQVLTIDTPTQVYHSAARRTTQTAAILQSIHPSLQLFPRKDLYNADLDVLLEIVDELKDMEHIILVGHNPGISQLHFHLTGNWQHFTPCSISQLHFSSEQKYLATEVLFLSPQI